MNKFSAEDVTHPNGKCFGIFNLLWSYITLISIIVGWKGNKFNIINQITIYLAFFLVLLLILNILKFVLKIWSFKCFNWSYYFLYCN